MEWIDIKERKPNVGETVLITVYSPGYFDEDEGHMTSEDYDILIGDMYNEKGFWSGYNQLGCWGKLVENPEDPSDYRVIAWMPIEPFRLEKTK